MFLKRRNSLVTAALTAWLLPTAAAAAPDPVRIVMVVRSTQIRPSAAEAFERRFGKGHIDLVLTTERADPKTLRGARIIFVEHGNVESMPRWKAEAAAALRGGAKIFSDLADTVPRYWDIVVDARKNEALLEYWHNGGEENMVGALAWMYREGGGTAGLDVPRPIPQLAQGAYHPDAPRLFPTVAEYLQWYRVQSGRGSGPLVGVFFFPTSIRARDTAHVDAVIRRLEREHLSAVGVFGWPPSSLGDVLDGADRLRLVLAFNLSLTRPEDPAFLQRLGVHVISLIATNQSYEQWAASPHGVTPERIGTSLGNPEIDGATEPIVVATAERVPGLDAAETRPIAERVDMAVRRATRWLALQDKPNAAKRLAMLYFNNPPGKGNIGASYLNIAPSITAALRQLRDGGFDVGDDVPDADTLMDLLQRAGRNVELWAPGELDRLVKEGRVTLISMKLYRQWFDALPKPFRDSVIARWGQPERSMLMTYRDRDGTPAFVVPGIRLGKVFVGPQLLRSSFEEYANAQHSGTLPPAHSYIAAYLWYRQVFHADALVHMGRHGTLEFLPGKNAGQAGWDASEVLVDDLPNLNYYIVDGDAEALTARRRMGAVLISHLTPMLVPGGPQAEYHPLNEAIHEYDGVKESSPALADQYRAKIVEGARALKLDAQLGLDWKAFDEAVARLHVFLDSIEDDAVPLGLATLGELPREDLQREALTHFFLSAFDEREIARFGPRVPTWIGAIVDGRTPSTDSLPGGLREKTEKAFAEAHTWLRNLRASPPRELDALTTVLAGRFLPSGPFGDPLRLPSSLPTGRNIHGMDPALIPTKAAWEVGKKLAIQFVDGFRREHGRFPERISMVLWQGETLRHQGIMEAEALYLLGVEPEWNARGVPDRLRLIPDADLGRPRVDVVFNASSLYRDGLSDKILFLDRAVRLAASAGENAISKHNRRIAAALRRQGLAGEDADTIATARVFSAAPGAYGLGLNNIVEQSKDFNNEQGMAELYLNRMNYVFGVGTWGRQVPKLLEHQMVGNEAVVHSRSSNVYGIADGDDVYQWMGGLNVVSRQVNGVAPDLMLNNLKAGGRERAEDLRSALVTELTARNWNPKWIKEMQAAGYSGAGTIAKSVEYIYGWQATAPEAVDESVWQNTYDVYVADKHGLGLDEFFEKTNPHARQALIARLLEIDRQGRHTFSGSDRARMVKEYVTSVNAHGAGCSANTCGNRTLHQYIAAQAPLVSGLGNIEWRDFGAKLGQATRWSAGSFRTAPPAVKAGLASAQPPRPPSASPPQASSTPSGIVSGFRLAETTLTLGDARLSAAPAVSPVVTAALGILFLLGAARELSSRAPWRRQSGRYDI